MLWQAVALVPNLPLLNGFAEQSLLALLLCRLASTEEGSHWGIIA